MMILPHSHYDAEVFLTREEYLIIGYKVIIDVLNALQNDLDYRFTLDQSAYIEPFLEAYPEMLEIMKDLVRSGRLEMAGGTYVMSDLNMVSGESIIRQIETGKGFFEKALDCTVKTGWNIDTFGHCAQMPQILKKSGFEHYVFSRAARSSHSEFYWQGLDGSRILTHWMPYHYAMFYNSPGWLDGFRQFASERYQLLKRFASTSVLAAPEGGDFTHPIRYDTELAREMNKTEEREFDLSVNTPSEFFEMVEQESKDLPTLTGDFNPVFQGCYSARIRMKQMNRLLENLLYGAEFLHAMGTCLVLVDDSWDSQKIWEPVLFNQVHDVLGGVQMDKVFDLAMHRYEHVRYVAEQVMADRISRILDRIDTRGDGIAAVIWNTLGWDRTDLVIIDIAYDQDSVFEVRVIDGHGGVLPHDIRVEERYQNGAVRQAQVQVIANVPAMGYAVYHVIPDERKAPEDAGQPRIWYGMEEQEEAVLENDHYRIRLNCWQGTLTSLVLKKTGQEYINPEMPHGNALIKEEDNGDFWEIGSPLRAATNRPMTRLHPLDLTVQKQQWSCFRGGSFSVKETAINSTFTFSQNLAEYTFNTRVSLLKGLPRIEIETDLVNRQKNVRYRIAIPTSWQQGTVTQETPFGANVREPGEYPALGWTDFTQPNQGLAILNCGLPGNSVDDGNMLLSLMRATSFVSYGNVGGFDPTNSSDGGHEIDVPHQFRYALVAHQGDWAQALIHRQSCELNHPLIVRKAANHSGDLPARFSFMRVDHPQVNVSSIRRRRNGLEVRVFEATGHSVESAHLVLWKEPASAVETDLLGNEIAPASLLETESNRLIFDLGPFEIRTFWISGA